MAKESPSMDAWLKEAKAAESAPRCGTGPPMEACAHVMPFTLM